MRIQHNISALNSHRQLGVNNNNISKSLEKLSSGYGINRAGDNAAGLAISEKMRAQIKGLEAAEANAQDAISLVQTAEGGLQEVHSMLNRMQELATKSSNGTYTDDVDRAALQEEVDALKNEINRISESTNFNGINLLDGSLTNTMEASIQFGASKYTVSAGKDATGNITLKTSAAADAGVQVSITATSGNVVITLGTKTATSYSMADIENAVRTNAENLLNGGTVTDPAEIKKVKALLSFQIDGDTMQFDATKTVADGSGTLAGNGGASSLVLQIGDTNDSYNNLAIGIESMSATGLEINDIDISTRDGAADAIEKIKTAINTVSTQRGKLGAIQNRLEHTINNLGVTNENITAAESRIRDVDMAKEMMTFTKNNVLMQSAQAMLAQANTQPQSVLQLLQ